MRSVEVNAQHDLMLKVHDLTRRLEEAQENLQAMHSGGVDAVVVSDGEKERDYTLRSADTIYRIMIEALNEGALILGSDGTIMYSNARFASMMRAPLEKILGAAFDHFVPENGARFFKTLLENGIKVERRAEMLLRRADGTLAPALLSFSQAEEALGLHIVVITDLTELHEAQEGLKKANAELESRVAAHTKELAIVDEELTSEIKERRAAEERAEELNRALQLADKRKDEFLVMLAHELRTPLSAITSAVQFMRLQEPGDLRLGRARDIAERQARHMARLLDDLLDISRITSGNIELHMERLELAPVLAQAVEMTGLQIRERDHVVTVNPPPEPVYVQADRDRLIQMITNLLNNAAKYTPPHGQIWVSAQSHGNLAEISVCDNGIGIPADILPRVYDLFMRADHPVNRAQRGLGIGLAMVRRLAELHGGNVSAHSEGEEKGSQFVIRLPLSL